MSTEPFDPAPDCGVDSGDSSNYADNGPHRDATPVEGPLSLGEPMPIQCADCGWPIGGTTAHVDVRSRTRERYQELEAGEHGAWCHRCKRLTVYSERAS